jgi:hypothetical protein
MIKEDNWLDSYGVARPELAADYPSFSGLYLLHYNDPQLTDGII